ncbi:Xaa-His dipeptidase [Clostridiales bacterium KA00134]|nr:Xaa-His dipeptidase [Clostridiales bacterium KA00134]
MDCISEHTTKVLEIFKEITKIPRPSHKENKIRKFLLEFANKNGLKSFEDETGNVFIWSRYESNQKSVILQAHMDMVCEKKEGFEIDFEKDEIPYEIEGDYMISKSTTLGADNGIGMAMILAALIDKENETPIEAIFTVNEEDGMTGASKLESSKFKSKTLINLDSAEESRAFGGCAGSKRLNVKFKKEFQSLDDSYICYHLIISGLQGGHSGEDIHLNLGNALVILARALYKFNDKFDIKVIDIYGGSKTNAIPRGAVAKIAIPKDLKIQAQNLIVNINHDFVKELGIEDPDVRINFEGADFSDKALKDDLAERIIDYLYLAPNGVLGLSKMKGALVESSCNLAIVESDEKEIIIHSSIRSSKSTMIENLTLKHQIMSKLLGAQYQEEFSYPAWEFNYDSEIACIAKKVYEDLYGSELEVTIVHAGLEPVLICKSFEDLDIISIGPNIEHLHAPGEKVSISSTNRTYRFLINILKEFSRRNK